MRQKKQFFFEKKNQKLLLLRVACVSPGWTRCRTHAQKFFASFFQKRRLFFLVRHFGAVYRYQMQDSDLTALSAVLRADTAPLHRQTEHLLGLPGSIGSPAAYGALLCRFLGLYEPLERGWHLHAEWERFGIELAARTHAAHLRDDLAALGVAAEDVPRADIRPPASFAQALGGMYVLEGATLGGHVIARDLRARLGAPIAGATRFFDGRGQALGPMWHTFRATLDRFGETMPQDRALVLSGARDTFRAMLAWFAPCRADPVAVP